MEKGRRKIKGGGEGEKKGDSSISSSLRYGNEEQKGERENVQGAGKVESRAWCDAGEMTLKRKGKGAKGRHLVFWPVSRMGKGLRGGGGCREG